jgi:transposase InsO family protein
LIEQFRRRYNEHQPHRSLGYQTHIEAGWASISRAKTEPKKPEAAEN